MKNLNIQTPKARKQGGFILTSELILLVTVMVIGMIVGLVTMRDAATAEMEDVAEAIGQFDQSYAFNGLQNAQNTAALEGSSFIDGVDTNAGDNAVFTYIANDNIEGGVTLGTVSAGATSAGAPGTAR